MAALAAYPELGCLGGPYKTSTVWGIHDDIYCAGNDDVFTFLQDILTEVIELFPSPYIHLAVMKRIKITGKNVQNAKIVSKKHHLKMKMNCKVISLVALKKFLNERGRSIIGWDEILEGGLAPHATVMSWRGTEGGIKAAQLHH